MPAVELNNLSKSFGDLRALDCVTATIPSGAVGLLGPNGAGKSTLIKCLLGLVKPDGGTISVLGIDAAGRPLELRQRIGYLPEVDCHIPGMSAVEYVSYAGELAGMPPKDAMTRAHEVLDYVGLSDERYRLVHTYSTGMRQRVKLAQALVHDPELLLLDEPTNGLDPRGRELMLELVRELRAAGMSIIYSSHLLADVEQVCNDVLILSHGRVLAQGKVEELLKGAEGLFELTLRGNAAPFLDALVQAGLSHSKIRADRYRVKLVSETEEDGDPVSARVFRAALGSGVQVRSFRPLRVTLEDVFIDALEAAGSAR